MTSASRPRVLCFAGSDPSAGAGLQVDLLSCAALGARAATVVTAITAQGPRGVLRVQPVDADLLRIQLEALLDLGPWPVVKVGLLPDAPTIRLVAEILRNELRASFAVVDPVLAASSGEQFQDSAARRLLVAELLPVTSLLTPNQPEAAALLDWPVETVRSEPWAATSALRAAGAHAVLLKGGHAEGDSCVDHLDTGDATRSFEAPRIQTLQDRGTGCTLASGIAALLAQGASLERSVRFAKVYLSAALRSAAGSAPDAVVRGPVDHACPLPPELGEFLAGLRERRGEASDGRSGPAP